MADMEDFLGKTVVDSIEGANKFNQQMDGLKLIGQRQINIAQQEQISSDRRYIRQLEAEIHRLKSQIHSLEKKASASDSGPSNGWAKIEHWKGVFYRNQSMEGYKNEVKRLQTDILYLNFSLLFKKINLIENNKHIELLSQYMEIPSQIIYSTNRIGVIKYLYEDKNKEFLTQLMKNESYQVGFFLNKKNDMFDLIDFNRLYTNFFAAWIGDVYINEEENLIKYIRENPNKLEKIKTLLGDTINHLQIDLNYPFQPTLAELKLFIRVQTIIQGARDALERYQGYVQMSNEEVQQRYEQAKQDILANNLTEREINIYELGLMESTRNNLKSGGFKFFELPNKINTKEDLDKFLYNLDLMKLEHRAIKKVLAYFAIKERELNPLSKKDEEAYERQYRDNDVGREVIENLDNLTSTLTTLNEAGKFNYPFMRSKGLIIYCASNQFINDEIATTNKRENEKRTNIINERQKEYDEGLELLKCWLKYKDEILAFLEKPDFSGNNGKIKIPQHLSEPINYIVNSDASIKAYDYLDGLKISDDPAHKLSSNEIQHHIEHYFLVIKSLVYQFDVSLVATEPTNIGSLFNRKQGREVYVRFAFAIGNPDFDKAFKFYAEHDIKPNFIINDRPLEFHINNKKDCNWIHVTPNVIYWKLGQFGVDEIITEANIVIKQTPNNAFHKNYIHEAKPLNKTFVFNKKVSELPLAPEHAKICYEKVFNQKKQDWQQLDKKLYVFTAKEMEKFSEGLRKQF